MREQARSNKRVTLLTAQVMLVFVSLFVLMFVFVFVFFVLFSFFFLLFVSLEQNSGFRLIVYKYTIAFNIR